MNNLTALTKQVNMRKSTAKFSAPGVVQNLKQKRTQGGKSQHSDTKHNENKDYCSWLVQKLEEHP